MKYRYLIFIPIAVIIIFIPVLYMGFINQSIHSSVKFRDLKQGSSDIDESNRSARSYPDPNPLDRRSLLDHEGEEQSAMMFEGGHLIVSGDPPNNSEVDYSAYGDRGLPGSAIDILFLTESEIGSFDYYDSVNDYIIPSFVRRGDDNPKDIQSRLRRRYPGAIISTPRVTEVDGMTSWRFLIATVNQYGLNYHSLEFRPLDLNDFVMIEIVEKRGVDWNPDLASNLLDDLDGRLDDHFTQMDRSYIDQYIPALVEQLK